MLEWIADPSAWLALITLTVLEIVLGIDNIIFITLLVARLPESLRRRARTLGLGLAMFTRIALLFSITWVMKLSEPLLTLFDRSFSGRDLILFGGGLFLLWKSSVEIYNSLEGEEEEKPTSVADMGFGFISILIQIALIDIIFSLDSVITAVGLADDFAVMALAIIIAVLMMMFMSHIIADFVDRHPSIKMLALSFLTMIGMALIGEAFQVHIPKGYIYFAMGFSVLVEVLNIQKTTRRAKPVKLHRDIPGD